MEQLEAPKRTRNIYFFEQFQGMQNNQTISDLYSIATAESADHKGIWRWIGNNLASGLDYQKPEKDLVDFAGSAVIYKYVIRGASVMIVLRDQGSGVTYRVNDNNSISFPGSTTILSVFESIKKELPATSSQDKGQGKRFEGLTNGDFNYLYDNQKFINASNSGEISIELLRSMRDGIRDKRISVSLISQEAKKDSSGYHYYFITAYKDKGIPIITDMNLLHSHRVIFTVYKASSVQEISPKLKITSLEYSKSSNIDDSCKGVGTVLKKILSF